MNHFQLFLNASTQMIFIVYASLSVLRVFRASTFLKGWQSGQGRGSGRATLPRALRASERSHFTPVGEQHHRGPGSPRAHLQLLQTMLFTSRGCYGGAQTQTTSTQALDWPPLSWRAYINTRLFHWVHWDILDADCLRVPQRCVFTSKHVHLYM